MGEIIAIHGKDYLMGSSPAMLDWLDQQAQSFPAEWFRDETPQKSVSVAAFLLDKYPTTNQEFADFCRDTGYITDAETKGSGMVYTSRYWEDVKGAYWRQPAGPESSIDGRDDHPVVHISWSDATNYAEWANKRLPTEEEWELAAKGGEDRLWPWGNSWNNEANTAEMHTGELETLSQWREWWLGKCAVNGPVPLTTPVGSQSPLGDSPYGVSDMAGNVYEWTASTSHLYSESTECDPTIQLVMGLYRAIRGGSWMNFRYQVRTTERMHGSPDGWSNFALGFRCAKSVDAATLVVPTAWAQRGRRTEFSIVPGGLNEVVGQFAKQNDKYATRLLDETGAPANYLSIFVNREQITTTERDDIVIAPGDEVAIIPPLAGG